MNKINNIIYLDYAATTPLFPEVLETMNCVSRNIFANPSSAHLLGLKAEHCLAESRKELSRMLGVSPSMIYFTSGATESNNWAFETAWAYGQKKGSEMLFCATDHASVRSKADAMKIKGAIPLELMVTEDGLWDMEHLEKILNPKVIFASILWVNNETGVIQKVPELIRSIREKAPKCVIHLDAVQGFAKLPDVRFIPGADLMSVSAHKIGGPKGVAALVVREGFPLTPLIYGGGQESGKRGGTENVAGIAGFAKAAELMFKNRNAHQETVRGLQALFENTLKSLLPESVYRLNGVKTFRSPYISNLSIKEFKGEVLVHALAEKNIFVSTQSACSSRKAKFSPVLQAMNVPKAYLEGTIRVSFFPGVDPQKIIFAAQTLAEWLKRFAPQSFA